MQVVYFNNYLTDSKRPQNLEMKPVQTNQQVAPPREERRERERGSFFNVEKFMKIEIFQVLDFL